MAIWRYRAAGWAAAPVRGMAAAALRHPRLRRIAVRLLVPFPAVRARLVRLAFPPPRIGPAGLQVLGAEEVQSVAALGADARLIYQRLRAAVDAHAG